MREGSTRPWSDFGWLPCCRASHFHNGQKFQCSQQPRRVYIWPGPAWVPEQVAWPGPGGPDCLITCISSYKPDQRLGRLKADNVKCKRKNNKLITCSYSPSLDFLFSVMPKLSLDFLCS